MLERLELDAPVHGAVVLTAAPAVSQRRALALRPAMPAAAGQLLVDPLGLAHAGTW
jgi:hypothetical protein